MVGDQEPVEEKAGDDGRVTFKPEGGGLVGVLTNTMDKDKSGELDGKPYKGVLHYASLTFALPGASSAEKKATGATEGAKPPLGRELGAERQAALPPLPEPVASFGAVVADGWLYVYGGHQGEEHEHSAANLSPHFRRLQLEGDAEWQELPMQTALQGFPLVAHGGKVYRVGGLDIRNPTTKDPEDLHSTAEFAEYDPATNKWTALTPLPAARSSHNAAVIGDRLYVVGGWRLEGKSPGTWEPDALVYDFTKPDGGWQKLPLPEFKRRALAAGVWKGKLLALGGMNDKGKVSMQVDVFDPESGKWAKGPDMPGAGLAGFGVSAWNLNGRLYVCGFGGILHRLNDAGSAWEEAGRMVTPRFFHQLVPGGNCLLAVGGASRKGHLADIERIEVIAAKLTAGKTAVLLVSHGSHSPQWREMLLDLEKDVEQQVLASPGIDCLRSAFMEYTEPSIATQLKTLDEEGYKEVILIPLLLTVSSHSFDDIPTIIGAKEDAKSLTLLASERIERYTPKAQVAITPLLDFSSLLEKNLLRRISRLTKNPASEGVVLVAYGSEPYNEEWESFFDRLDAVVKRQAGVIVVKHCWCGHIVHYQKQPTVDAIRDVLEQAQRAIVVPVLVANDENFQDKIIGGAVNQIAEKDRVAYVPDSILPDPALNEWIVSIAQQTYQELRASDAVSKGALR